MNFNVLESAREQFPWMLERRRYLHKHPELSFLEFETSDFILKELTALNIRAEKVTETGVLGVIGSGSNCVALRADMDALPITEESGLDFASVNQGIMHACGHDLHMTMLLGAAKILKMNEDILNGCVKLIFQPGEEKIPGGASLMIKAGVLENPVPRFVFGQHINPSMRTGTIAGKPGAFMASSDELYWEIKGTSCHAAQPHLGNDPILAASQLTVSLQTLMTKFRDPMKPAVLTVTSIHGGEATNIIPEKVSMKGTLRFFDNDLRFEILERINDISQNVAKIYNLSISFNPLIGYPPVINDTHAAEIAAGSAAELFGQDNYLTWLPMMWGEDFAYYGQNVPSCFWFTGCNGDADNAMPSLHNCRLAPDENAMIYGTAMMINTALKGLE